MDPDTRLPRIEDHDAPWEAFQLALKRAGFHLQPIQFECSKTLSRMECPLVLLVASRDADALRKFCMPLAGDEL